ncbi:hypothetical protein [Streptacidiphilus sp. PAMC 29251]
MNLLALFRRTPASPTPGRHSAQWTSMQIELAELRQRPSAEDFHAAVQRERCQLQEIHSTETGQLRAAVAAERRGWHQALHLAGKANAELRGERDILQLAHDRLEGMLTALRVPVDATGIDVPAPADLPGSYFTAPEAITPTAGTGTTDPDADTQTVNAADVRDPMGMGDTAEIPIPARPDLRYAHTVAPDPEADTRPMVSVGLLAQLAST